jgi:hypothetical protein
MARDFEDIHGLDDLNDGELRDLVRQQLADNNTVDIDDLTIRVEDGTVILTGRVGTDQERRVAEHVVTDVLGIQAYRNEIFIDPIRRAASPEAIDEHLVDESQREGLLLSDRALPLSPEAEHLVEREDAQLYGTTDVQHAIEDGTAWIPPESPTPEGLAERGEQGEDH